MERSRKIFERPRVDFSRIKTYSLGSFALTKEENKPMGEILYEALISDFDGVLWPNSEAINREAVVQTMRARGFTLTEGQANSTLGRPSSETIKQFLTARNVFTERHYEAMVKENRDRYDRMWDEEVRLDPIIHETLREIHRRRIPIAIATTNRRSVVNKFIRRFDLREIISVIVTGEDVKNKKPDPEVYIKASQWLKKERCLAVEDMPIGIQAALGAGLHCAAIPNQYSPDLSRTGATYPLGSFSELLKFF